MEPASEGKSVSKDLLGRLFQFLAKYILLAVVVLVIIGGALIVWTFDKRQNSVVYYFLAEAGKAIVITALVTGTTKWYLAREYNDLISTGQQIYEDEYKQELKSTLDKMEEKILSQTQTIAHYASSLDAMQKADIVQLYESRAKASEDIEADMQDPDMTYLRIIGISLNDFLRPGGGALHEAWRTIERYIRGEQTTKHPLDIKALLIDPACNGAYLRSKAEETEGLGIAGRLESDVLDSMKALHNLEQLAKEHKGIHFEVKLYRTPPVLYLVQTNFVSYVQQYNFWPQYEPELNIPVIRYQGRGSSNTQGRSMQDEMKFHFDYIWNNCAVYIHEYLEDGARGCDSAIRQASIENMYYDSELCRKRILSLMNNTKERLYIKGITLRSFFSDGELFNTFSRVVSNGTKVRVLLIDPESEQAKIRSFREYLLKNPDAKWADFCSGELHRSQILYTHAHQSIDNLRSLLGELKGENVKHDMIAKMFSSAPECYMLMTDHSMLIEQYHYGKIRLTQQEAGMVLKGKILGGDVPVVEYKKPDSQESREYPLRNMYRIFEDHFQFVFDNFAKDINY